MHDNATRPHRPMPDAGRIFALTTHGSVVYLTGAEHALLTGLMAAGAGAAIIAALIYFLAPRG